MAARLRARERCFLSAQAAHAFGLKGTAAFQNLAVSGSTPSNWAPGGYLSPELEQIVHDDPNLTIMTLGANPLLSIFLTGSGAFCAFSFTDAELRACVTRYIHAQRLGPLLKEVVGELLAAPRNHVVVSLYHLAIPSVTPFRPTRSGSCSPRSTRRSPARCGVSRPTGRVWP